MAKSEVMSQQLGGGNGAHGAEATQGCHPHAAGKRQEAACGTLCVVCEPQARRQWRLCVFYVCMSVSRRASDLPVAYLCVH